MQDQLVTIAAGIVIGFMIATAVYRRTEKALRKFWHRAFDNELKAHAETKEHHDATIRSIATILSYRGLEMRINGKSVYIKPQLGELRKLDDSGDEWPELIEH